MKRIVCLLLLMINNSLMLAIPAYLTYQSNNLWFLLGYILTLMNLTPLRYAFNAEVDDLRKFKEFVDYFEEQKANNARKEN